MSEKPELRYAGRVGVPRAGEQLCPGCLGEGNTGVVPVKKQFFVMGEAFPREVIAFWRLKQCRDCGGTGVVPL
jgi:hypothetical protein